MQKCMCFGLLSGLADQMSSSREEQADTRGQSREGFSLCLVTIESQGCLCKSKMGLVMKCDRMA